MKRLSLIILAMAWGILANGCGQTPPPPPQSLTQVQKNFVKIASEEYGLKPVTRTFDNTLWVYLPLENSFFDLKASPAGPKNSDKSTKTRAINYLDAHFDNNAFSVEYDITATKKYTQDYGYNSNFTEDFQNKQRHVLTALFRAFSDVEQVPGEEKYVLRVPGDVDYASSVKNDSHKELVHAYVKTEKVPDFFVIVFADVSKGLETRMLVYIGDLLRASSDPTFTEEYNRRIIMDLPTGNQNIVGDREGTHLDWHDVSWGEFLAKQMVYRIRFKFQRSDFKPTNDTDDELLAIIAETLQGYNFSKFQSIQLHDLDTDKQLTLNPEQIKTFLPK